MQTLPLRMEKAQANAALLAAFLSTHPKVTWVRYPGLPEHPQYAIAKKQMDGFGTMTCFGVKNGLEVGITVLDDDKNSGAGLCAPGSRVRSGVR